MIFQPQDTVVKAGSFTFAGDVCAIAHPSLSKTVPKELWHGATFRTSHLSITESSEYIFSIGSATPTPLDGFAYSIHIEPSGACVLAATERDLIHGFVTLLDRFKATDQGDTLAIEADCCTIRDKAAIQSRMVHFCVFPETELWELQRFIRLCGALKYTHIVLEFWGMLQYDCQKELAWPMAFSKAQLKPILGEAAELGLEIVPMFNHWGHASSGRVMHGKHVVLDQNPSLQPYFSQDGWCWDIRNPKVKELLRRVRSELIELCGNGSYFHVGCDEAYNFALTKDNMDLLCDFINDVVDEMRKMGRRAIAWGDMLLYRHPQYNPNNKYTCNAPSPEAEQYMLSRLDKALIIADWQYDATESPIETASVFQKAGFDCLLCPWDRGKPQMNAVITTVKEQGLMGFMHTTWHTLSKGMPYVTLAAIGGFAPIDGCTTIQMRTSTAALLRKVMFANGNYERAGWSKLQIDSLW